MVTKIAILGDYNTASFTHNALNSSIEHCARFSGIRLKGEWISTGDFFTGEVFNGTYSGLWVAPGSPYKNTNNVLKAIRYTRENNIPAFGNCGGFQHMIIEFAGNVCGIENADHGETNPLAENLVITELSCALVKKEEELSITATNSQLFQIIRQTSFTGSYMCSYGINEAFKERLVAGGCLFTAYSKDGYIRAFELKGHPFFMGTLFQPALLSTEDNPNPIILAFLKQCMANSLL